MELPTIKSDPHIPPGMIVIEKDGVYTQAFFCAPDGLYEFKDGEWRKVSETKPA